MGHAQKKAIWARTELMKVDLKYPSKGEKMQETLNTFSLLLEIWAKDLGIILTGHHLHEFQDPQPFCSVRNKVTTHLCIKVKILDKARQSVF